MGFRGESALFGGEKVEKSFRSTMSPCSRKSGYFEVWLILNRRSLRRSLPVRLTIGRKKVLHTLWGLRGGLSDSFHEGIGTEFWMVESKSVVLVENFEGAPCVRHSSSIEKWAEPEPDEKYERSEEYQGRVEERYA